MVYKVVGHKLGDYDTSKSHNPCLYGRAYINSIVIKQDLAEHPAANEISLEGL